jgi:TorA maturation chaperone TorD
MELFRALAVLCEPPRAETARVAEALGLGRAPAPAEFTEAFVFQLPPYASVYLGAEGMLGGEARDRVAGFWRAALGQEVPPAEPDHLPLMLALYARLAELEGAAGDAPRREGWRAARKAFLWEHLSSWTACYLRKLAEVAPPACRAWGELLRAALAEEGLDAGRSETQIVPLVIGDPHQTVKCSERALDRGVFAQAIRPPSVAPGTSRLRLTVMASHTAAELRWAAQVLRASFPQAPGRHDPRAARPGEPRIYDGLGDTLEQQAA